MRRNERERERERERRGALNNEDSAKNAESNCKNNADSANCTKNAESNCKNPADSALDSAKNANFTRDSANQTKNAESNPQNPQNTADSANFAESPKNPKNPKNPTNPKFPRNVIRVIFPSHGDLSDKDYKTYRDISIFAILNICFLVCVFSPFALYASDVTQFDATQTTSTLCALAGFFILTSGAIIYATSFFYKTRLLKLGVFAFVVVFLINSSYAFIFRGNIFTGRPYAQIDGLLFQDGGAGISSIWAKYFDIGYGFAMMFVAFLLLCFCRRFFKKALIFLFATMLISSTIDIAKITIDTGKTTPKQHTKIAESSAFEMPSEIAPLFSFSKEKNILIIFSDMVQSDNFTQILKDDKNLFDEFSGFTYFRNTLSVANITFGSAPAISGGIHYSPMNINSRNLSHNIITEGTRAVADSANEFSKAGFKVALGTSYPSNDALLAKALNKDIFIFPQNKHHIWGDFYRANFPPKHISSDSRPIGELFSYGLFRAAPYIFRTRIYLLGGWIFGNSIYANHLRHTTNQAGYFLAFAKHIKADSAKPTFKFLYEGLEHFPWMLRADNDCKPIDSIAQYRNKLINDKSDLAYSNHKCYVKNLLTLLNALKTQGIYDSTKIIIVSDHGNGGLGAPIIDFPMRAARNSHIFFMVKDFNAKGRLKIDDETFITNADTMAVACDEINSVCPNIAPSVLKNPIKNRELIYTIVDGGTGREQNNKYDINVVFKVKNNIFDLKNWEQIK
ncbi:hypothetical protein ACWIUD_02775 [Helicobacter sp. 23-1044]